MPLHVAPLSRRAFLARASVAAAGLTVLRSGWGASPSADPNVFALLSDTHVPSTPDITSGSGTNMTSNMRQAVREVVAHPTRPAAVFINGDCAYLKGLADDYKNLAQCVAPLGEAGLPLHVTMGNHDHRGRLFEKLAAQKPERPLLESKHVTVVESPWANWFLLDSLTETDVVTGEIGAEQRGWLDKALKARSDKPAIVMSHHTPQFEPPPEGKVWGGIKDTAEFMDLLASHRNVKAFIYGHSHVWENKRQGALHLINLPPVAYVFKEGLPNGWVEARVRENGMDLNLRAINPAHPLHNQKVALDWN
jgi:3',5'-cyclic-AMP phosphodiesterase